MKNLVKLAFLALCFAATVTSCVRVDNSEIGLKYKKFSVTDQGKLEASTVTGYVWFNPFTESVYTYPTFVQRAEYEAFSVTTKDGTKFSMDPTLAYYLEREKAIDVFTKYRKKLEEIQDGYMKTCIYDAYRITANNYTSDSLMANKAKFEKEVRDMLDISLGNEGFKINEFTSDIVPPESLQDMIDAKNRAIQAALKAENEVKEAEANARTAVAQAEGEAQALRVKADGIAYYNATVAASITDLLVRQEAIEKWNGELPTYNGGGAVPFIDVSPKK